VTPHPFVQEHLKKRVVPLLVLSYFSSSGAEEEVRWSTGASDPQGYDSYAMMIPPRLGISGDSTTTSGHPLQLAREATPTCAQTSAQEVRHLRERSGLTWDQLARLMQVDRRSLHNWANGSPMFAANGERLRRLVAVIDFVDRGFVDATAKAILSSTPDGRLVLDWLAEGRDEDVRRHLGRGAGPRNEPSRSSQADRESRRPPSFATLLEARHDVAHVEIGKRRIVGKVRGPA